MTRLYLDDLLASQYRTNGKNGSNRQPPEEIDPADMTLGQMVLLWAALTALIIVRAIADVVGWLADQVSKERAKPRRPARPPAPRPRSTHRSTTGRSTFRP